MRFLLVFLLLTFSTFVSATDYYWTYGNSSNPHYSDPSSACEGMMSAYYGGTTFAGYTYTGPVEVDATTYNCMGSNSDGQTKNFLSVGRFGDSCSTGSTLNASTGICEGSSKCAAAAGATAKSYHVAMTSGSNPPSTISVNGCEATFGGVMLCKNTTKGQYVCTGDATITGKELAATSDITSEECTGDACTAGQPTDTKTDQDCVYAADGTGKATCTATASASHPGTTSCGTVNDVWTCVENPKSSSTDSTLYSEKTDVSNTDGTVTSTKDNTLTVIKCDGVNSCTTTTTSSTGTTTTKSDGTVVSNASTCSGSNCTSTGSTASASDATSDGDDDNGGPTLTPLKAIAKGSFDGAADSWDAKTETARADLEDLIAQMKTKFSLGVNLAASGGKLYCPQPVTIPVLNVQLSFCLDQYADSLSWIGSAIYVACAILALFIIYG